MSHEGQVISALVEEGSPKKAFAAGITRSDFEIYDEEFEWIERRAERQKLITPQVFKDRFPEFDLIPQRGSTDDLLDVLKEERAYIAVSSAIDEIMSSGIEPGNALEKASQLKELMGDVIRSHGMANDIALDKDYKGHLEEMKRMQILQDNGEILGIPSGIRTIDNYCGGLLPSTVYLVLGRPGDAKSMLLALFAVRAMLAGHRVGFFSPEMREHAHRSRFNTLLSADPGVQEALGLKKAFRNRSLLSGHGFNIKSYARFLKYCDEEVTGSIVLITQKWLRSKMSAGYIEARVEEHGLDMVIVDPIYELKSPQRRLNRVEELADIVGALTDIAYGHNIPLVMSNQANRALVSRNSPPSKDTSYGADSPVHVADVVMGVKHFSEERILKIFCSKNRYGEPFKASVKFHPNIGVLDDITPARAGFENGFDPEKASDLLEAMKQVDD